MASRNGITLSEMFDEEVFERKLKTLAYGFKKRFGDLLEYDVDEEIQRFKGYRTELQVCNSTGPLSSRKTRNLGSRHEH